MIHGGYFSSDGSLLDMVSDSGENPFLSNGKETFFSSRFFFPGADFREEIFVFGYALQLGKHRSGSIPDRPSVRIATTFGMMAR
jgi:hypothetical protein